MVWVVAWRVQDGDADEAARVNYDGRSFQESALGFFLLLFWPCQGQGGWLESWKCLPLGCHTSARNFMDGGARG